jgi:predicted permease
MNLFLPIFERIAPVFLVLFCGTLLRKLKVVDEQFVGTSSAVVFYAALPALIFTSIASAEWKSVFDLRLVLAACGAAVFVFIVSWILSVFFVRDGRSRGAFIQGAYRGNTAIVGLAIISLLLGSSAVTKASLMLAVLMPLYSGLSVVCLAFADAPVPPPLGTSLKQVFLNPIVIASIAALPFSIWSVRIPPVLLRSMESIALLALPLALIGIGAGLSTASLKKERTNSLFSGGLKLVLYPLAAVVTGVLIGMRGEELGVLFLLAATPTAVASFPMARVMKANAALASGIIVFTTLASALTIPIGLAILKALGWV